MAFAKRWWWVIGYLVAYFVIVSLVVVNRWDQYEMTYFDHGIYDQALWSASRFRLPLIDHVEAKPINQLGDHFTPLMYLLVPIYWLTSSYTAIFYVQNVFMVLSMGVMAHIAWRKLHSRWAVLLILVSSTLFIGLQNALIGDFHADLLGLFPLAMTLYFLDSNHPKRFYFWLLVMFFAKESYVLIGASIALFLFFEDRKKQAFSTLLLSVFYYLAAAQFLMPWIAGRPYQYGLSFASLPTMILRFFVPMIKVKTMFVSLLTFGFLPLLAPAFLPVIAQDWVMRFVFNLAGTRIDLGMHYNSMITLLLAYGSIAGLGRIQHWNRRIFLRCIPFLTVAVCLSTFGIHRIWYHGPLGLATNSDFYRHSADFAFLNNFVAAVPSPGLIMTSNNLSVKLTHSREVMLFRKHYWDYMPAVIMVDIREGQNANHYWPLSPDELTTFVDQLKIDPNYTIRPFTKNQLYFIKNSQVDLHWYDHYEI